MPIDASLLENVIAWRRHLHAHPELSGLEHETAAYVSSQLTAMGIEHTTGVGGHGVVARMHRSGSNRSVGLRADMDALPIAEANVFAHRSTRAGVMHACGHDGHTAALLGAARVLNDDQRWTGTIHLFFQPSEENGRGAKAMLADGLFERFPTDRLFAWHNLPGRQAGEVAVHRGPSMAAGGDWRVKIRGVGGHAAAPHLTRDPVTAAAHLIVGLNSIVPRNVDPIDTVVLTVSMIHAGSVSNQIPEVCEVTGTLRTFDADVRKAVIARMEQMIEGTAASFGVAVDYEINSTGRVMADTEAESDLAINAAHASGLSVSRNIRAFMGGDDFAFLVGGRPGAYVHIGNGPIQGKGELHNAEYEFNDAILAPAIAWLANVARMALKE